MGAIEFDLSHPAASVIRVEGTIDQYMKIGDLTKGNPFVHCLTFSWKITGGEPLANCN